MLIVDTPSKRTGRVSNNLVHSDGIPFFSDTIKPECTRVQWTCTVHVGFCSINDRGASQSVRSLGVHAFVALFGMPSLTPNLVKEFIVRTLVQSELRLFIK
ncbi:UNVERIFIED_CONTAM: hypothetical protein Sangu_2901900 [Sesamum angustifolium]|uniref:Uncharacterized protein n=1 Tax=Sesamum angustifolium TaxID=2727405 RepID=A0AAW2ILP4_9LAMI